MRMKVFFLMSTLITCINGFKLSFFDKSISPKLIEDADSLSKLNQIPNNRLFDLYDNFVPDEKKPEIGEAIVRSITAWLPNADSIGHIILHKNEELINVIFNSNFVPPEQKKFLILTIIDLARNGDNMGSQILTFYHDLVQHVL